MGSIGYEEFDYIICGGGNAGCVIASRLAENPNVTVLVLEAGAIKADVPLSNIPGCVFNIMGSNHDWNIQNEPTKVFGGRQIDLHRGKFVGGSSGANGALCIRGTRHDFDSWGLSGWSGDEVFQYMAKAETFKGEPWFEADESAHGHDGPVITAPHVNAPISDLVMESYQSAGLPLVPDMFTSGNVPNGCGHAVRTIHKGLRSTAADYLQGPYIKSSVTIKSFSYADSLVLIRSESGRLKATGVRVAQVNETEQSTIIYKARKEVVVCGGAYGSPALLLRSGIGPKLELEKHSIQCSLDLGGVGKNLQDHLINFSFYEVSAPNLTNDHLIWHDDGASKSLQQWHANKSGFMSQIPFGAFAYARLDERLSDSPLWQSSTREEGRDPMGTVAGQPHVEFWNTECYNPKYFSGQPLAPGKSAFGIVTELFSQRSRGRVTLRSTDPLDKPVVDHNYLSDPLDILVFSEGCRLADEIVRQGAGTKDIVTGMMPTSREKVPESREDWEEEIRQRGDTCFHPGGTCKMGNAGDPSAVVDPELRVLGVEGLRVADASIIPTLPCGHTQMTVYAIAEKAADMIKASSP